jgi:nitrous oxidase accessory protein NosD
MILTIICLFVGSSAVQNISSEKYVSKDTVDADDNNTGGLWNGTQAYPYKNIQDGLDAANDGETVYVYRGTYYGDVVINEQITLQIDEQITIKGQNKMFTMKDSGGTGNFNSFFQNKQLSRFLQ